MSKIAPVTTALLADLRQAVRLPPQTKEKAGDAQVLRIVVAEVRAMKMVVRAAQRFMDRDGRGDQYGIPRALARLSRAGRGRGK